MNKKRILEQSIGLSMDLGDVTYKLIVGLENLTHSSGGSSLLTSQEYIILRERVKNKKTSTSFSGITDINREIKKNLKLMGNQIANTSLLTTTLLHEAESRDREHSQNNNDLKIRLENYQIEICYLEHELAKYKK